MSELSFLLELLLNHKLPRITKELITNRIKEVEILLTPQQQRTRQVQPVMDAATRQAKIEQAQADQIARANGTYQPPVVQEGNLGLVTEGERNTGVVQQIAQTPEASAALQYRQNLMNGTANETLGNIPKGKASPRKW